MSCRIPFASLGVTRDSALSMKQQINTKCRACYFHIRQISTIRKFMIQETVVKLVSCFVLRSLDYCNSLLEDFPTESINKLQNVQNCAARLALGIRKCEHITPALKNLHWLPISRRIHYKLSLLCYKSFNSLIPSYLSERTQPVSFCGRASRTHQLLYGVPQGSVLEPVLFTLYMQPLALVIRCHDVLYHFLC